MNPIQKVVYEAMIYTLIAMPILPLGISWNMLIKMAGNKRRAEHLMKVTVALMVISTLSYFWFVAGIFSKDVIGADYSSRRFVTIESQLCLTVAVFIAAAFCRNSLRGPLLVGTLSVASCWLFALSMSSVV